MKPSPILIKILLCDFWVNLAKTKRFDCNQTCQEQARIGQVSAGTEESKFLAAQAK
jgi:hypothetical protein